MKHSLRFILPLLLVLSIPVTSMAETNGQEQTDTITDDNFIGDTILVDDLFPEEEMAFSRVDTPSDPLKDWNRTWFTFNDHLYYSFFKPVSRGYSAVLPEPVRVSVRNFFHNLATPKYFVSSLVQGKIKQAAVELGRFGINSTIGLLGLMDIAQEFELKSADEDIGQSLGYYGAGDTPYLVWPIIGPSNLRDSVGLVFDALLDPINYVTGGPLTSSAMVAYRTINESSLREGEYEEMKKATIADPYFTMRDAYLQKRHEQITH